MLAPGYDALLVVSFGGPEAPDEVMPFLERVAAGRNIPRERLRTEALRDGDVLYFVLDEHSKRGRKLRQEYGLLVGHQGIVARRGAEVDVIHAARDDLPGAYAGNRVVRTTPAE